MARRKNQLSAQAEIAYLTQKKSESDPVVWAVRNINLPKGLPWDFEERGWQLEILDSLSKCRRVVIKKPTQVGLTTIATAGVLHYLNYHSATAMYTLPRRDDISDFVGSSLNPTIQSSPHLRSIIGDTDSVRLKRFRYKREIPGGATETIESFLHLMEGSVEPRMIPVDLLINDEVDRSDQNFLEIFQARLDASHDPHHFQFSSPTLPGYGVDKLYEDTTQNEWHVRCGGCNQWQFIDWEKHLVTEPEPHYECENCHSELTTQNILDGKWIPLFPSRDIVGYHASHTMMPISYSPASLQKQLTSGKMNKRNFFNLRLGLAYSSATGVLTKEILRRKCFDSPHIPEQIPLTLQRYYMGVDQGNDIHILIARRDGKLFRVVYAKRIPYKSEREWPEEIIILMRLFGIRFCVIDFGPNTHDARKVWQEFPDRVALCQYSEIQEALRRDQPEGKVHVNKTEMFDGLRDEVADGQWKLYGRFDVDEEPMRIVSHITALRRDEREQADGQTRAFWVPVAADHYAHAMNYVRIASLIQGGAGMEIVSLSTPPQDDQVVVSQAQQTAHYKVWGVLPPETTLNSDVEDKIKKLFPGEG